MRTSVRFILRAVGMIGSLNFIWCFILFMVLRGDAYFGGHHDGRYFVRNHSEDHEVPREAWLLSYWSMRSLWVTFPMAFVAAGFYWFARKELDDEPEEG